MATKKYVSIANYVEEVLKKNYADWKKNERENAWKEHFPNEDVPTFSKAEHNIKLLNAMQTAAAVSNINKNWFNILKTKQAMSENNGNANTAKGAQACNKYYGKYHIGWQQLSSINFYIFSNYISTILPDSKDYLDIFYSDLLEALENDITAGFINSENPNYKYNLSSSEFPKYFDESVQDLFFALYVLEKLRKRSINSLEEIIINNPTGWINYTDISQLNNEVHPDDPSLDITYLQYICYSDDDLPPSPKNLSEIFKTPITNSQLISASILYLQDKWEKANNDHFFKRVFRNTEDIRNLLNIDNFNKPHLFKPTTWKKEAKAAIKYNYKEATEVAQEKREEVQQKVRKAEIKTDDPRFYIWGENAEETGSMYIGDIYFTIPPVSVRFSSTNQAMTLPTIRTKGDPVITTNNEMNRVDLTLYFSGEDAINKQLRPLIAMFQSMPFTTIQNTTIYDSWVGRKNTFTKATEEDLDEAEVLKRRFGPIAIYLENISLSTLPGFPNTIQAHLSIVRMNRFPYGVVPKMWKSWEDAKESAIEKSLRYSLDNTIVSTAHDQLDKDTNNPRSDAFTTISVLDSVNKYHEIKIGNSNKNYKVDDETYVTRYPQESIPFQIQYKDVLRDFPTYKGLREGRPTKNENDGDLEKYWPKYRPEHNNKLYLTYNTPKGFKTAQSLFKVRMSKLGHAYTLMKTVLAELQGTDASDSMRKLKELYQDVNTKPDISKILLELAKTVSYAKEATFFVDSLNDALRTWIRSRIQDETFGDYIQSSDLNNGIVTLKIPDSTTGQTVLKEVTINLEDEIFVVADTLELKSAGKEFLDRLGKLAEQDILSEDGKKIGSALENFIGPLFEELSRDPLGFLGLSHFSSLLNYDKVHLTFNWMSDPVPPLDADIFSAKTEEQKKALRALGSAVDIDDLINQNQHYDKNEKDPYVYQFQTVLQSISYNYANNVIPHYLSSSTVPTFQHMGISNPSVSLSFRTRDERFHKILTDMKEAIQEVGSMILAGETSLLGMDKLIVSGNYNGANVGTFSGHLLNSLGFTECVIQNVSSRSLEGYPGWWEVSIDLLGDSQNLRLLEQLKPLSIPELSDLPYVTQHFFPTPLLNILNLPEFMDEKDKNRLKYLVKLIRDWQAKRDYVGPNGERNPEHLYVKSEYGYYDNGWAANLVSANMSLKRFYESYYQKISKKFNYLSAYIELDDSTETVPIIHLNTADNEAKELANAVLNSDVKAHITGILHAVQKWENQQRKDDPTGFGKDYPIKFSITSTLKAHYTSYIKNVFSILFNLMKTRPDAFTYTNSNPSFYPIVGLPFESDEDNPIYLEFLILSNRIKTSFFGLLRRQDFRQFLDYYIKLPNKSISSLTFVDRVIKQIEDTAVKLKKQKEDEPTYESYIGERLSILNQNKKKLEDYKADDTKNKSINKKIDINATYTDLIKTINEAVTDTHPDLRLPRDSDSNTGHRYISPGFPFVDQDPELEIIEMSKAAEELKIIVFGQFAAISSGKFLESYKGLKALFIGEDGTEDADAKMNVQKAMHKLLVSKSLGKLLPTAIDPQTSEKYTDISAMIRDLETVGNTISDTLPRDDSDRIAGTYYWIDENNEPQRSNYSLATEYVEAHWTGNIPPETAVVLTHSQLETWEKDKTLPKMQRVEQLKRITKVNLINLMSRAAMLDYLVTMVYAASLNETLATKTKNINVTLTLKELKKSASATYEVFANFNMDLDSYKETLAKALTFETQLAKIGNETHEVGMQIAAALLQKRTLAINMAKMVDEDNPDAFLQYFGVGDIDNAELKWEMLGKFNNYLQTKRKGTMDRAFPTFKIFFIEEDNYAWKAFDDFYSYDAASEISIVESKHAASKTAVLRLSNVTNVLTNDVFANLANEGSAAVSSYNLNLKIGTQIMILVGYGSDYRQLRMKFKGAITEINPGSVLEVTAQSWGAGLLNNVGAVGGVSYSSTSGATSLGAAVIDILAQTPGLSHLGRWQIRDEELNNPDKVAETSFKNAYWAKAISSLAGPLQDFNPIQSNFMDIIKNTPTTYEELQTSYRQNNVIVKSFGNSLYDNIIINNTRAHGYGFTNWFYRVWDEASSMFTDEAGFQWHVVRQSAWDALHEAALFLGDYIVTTLPFDEGNDIFLNPPRETLYFGPREGQYQASRYLPKINIEQQLKEIIDMHKISKPVKEELRTPEQEHSDSILLQIGKTILAKTLDVSWKYGNPCNRIGGIHMKPSEREKLLAGKSDYGWSSNTDLLSIFVRTLESNGWSKVADLIKKSVAPRGTEDVGTIISSDKITKTALHEILLNDFEGKHMSLSMQASKFQYSTEDLIISNDLVNGKITNYKGEGDNYTYHYPAHTVNNYSAVVSSSKQTFNALYNPGWGTASPFEEKHKEDLRSSFYYIFYSFKGTTLGAIMEPYFKNIFYNYLPNIDKAIVEDAYNQLIYYQENKKRGNLSKSTGVDMDIEAAISSLRGTTQIFQYKPVIGMHVVNSYEDILDNSIIATADQMYNHVEVLFDDEPDPTNNISNAKYRSQAWISYDQDPDYMRTYQTYMKNMDSHLFFNTFEANTYINNANSDAQQATMLTQHAIAQQVLMNVMKPMYQGTLTMLGNPHIKPWDQVFIHDDSIAMYGPVEVEQVVNTISATGGYTTTIIPNLCVTYKSASKQIDNLILSIQTTIQTMGFIGTILKHAASIGAVWFAMKPKMLSPKSGEVGGVIGRYLKKGAKDAAENLSTLKDFKKISKIEQIKKVAKGNLSGDDFTRIESVGDDFVKMRKKAKMLNKQLTITYKYIDDLRAPMGTFDFTYRNVLLQDIDDQLNNIEELTGKKPNQKIVKDIKEKVKRKNVSKATLKKQIARVKALRSKTIREVTTSSLDDVLKSSINSLNFRSGMMSAGLKVLNWVGWAYTAYEIGSAIWESFENYANSRIFLAGLLAGENQLTWMPLEYQGKSYVAGLEGILGSSRDIDTVLWGEFQGDNSNMNRVISVLKRQMEQV